MMLRGQFKHIMTSLLTVRREAERPSWKTCAVTFGNLSVTLEIRACSVHNMVRKELELNKVWARWVSFDTLK